MIFGHTQVRTALEERLPPVALLRGPSSVGKWSLAEYAIDYHKVLPVDRRVHEQLTVDAARELRHFAGIAPFGSFKAVLLRLDGADESALNALLKLLEEPPKTVRFLLVADRAPLATIVSRSIVYRCGLLSIADLYQVLTERLGLLPALATSASQLARGQVHAATLVGEFDQSRAAVLSLLKAIADKDSLLLEAVTPAWTEACQALLERWCVEAISGNWGVFTERETYGLSKTEIPRKILVLLRVDARPKLLVRTVIASLLEKG